MTLTHDALGELVGARRPTVTLALKELTHRGSVFRQKGHWLLLKPPSQAPVQRRTRSSFHRPAEIASAVRVPS
jgi:DNA-binding GntR family transcriptional regulator